MDIFITSPSSSLLHIKSTSEIYSSAMLKHFRTVYSAHKKSFKNVSVL